MTSIRTLIVDDDSKPRALLAKAITKFFPQMQIVAEANSVESAVQAIRAQKPDIVFLDVDLTYGTGFDVLDALAQPTDPEFAVIFVTAFEEYAVRAIEYSAVGYIVKPVDEDEFRRKMQKTINRLFAGNDKTTSVEAKPQELPAPHTHVAPAVVPPSVTVVNPLADKIALPSAKGKELVAVQDIVYCEAQSNYTEFHLAAHRTILVAKTLKDCEEQLLPRGFFRIHRSHLINLAHLKEVVREGNSLFVRLAGVQHLFAVARMFHESLLDRLP